MSRFSRRARRERRSLADRYGVTSFYLWRGGHEVFHLLDERQRLPGAGRGSRGKERGTTDAKRAGRSFDGSVGGRCRGRPKMPGPCAQRLFHGTIFKRVKRIRNESETENHPCHHVRLPSEQLPNSSLDQILSLRRAGKVSDRAVFVRGA